MPMSKRSQEAVTLARHLWIYWGLAAGAVQVRWTDGWFKGGVPSPHPGATCRHGPRRRRTGQGPPKAGPQDREAPLTRTPSGAVSAGWPRQRPVRGRVQGPGRGAEGEAVHAL